jgi:hypothetical protein
MDLSETAKTALRDGKIKIKITRAGMIQVHTLVVKRVKLGNSEFAELYIDRLVDAGALAKAANEAGLPVEAKNGRAFPSGTSATDYVGL